MATSSVPAAIDYLVATFAAMSAASGVIVSDGFTTARGDKFLLVGIDDETGESSGTHEWAAIGNNSQDEEYEIPCLIQCFGGGTSSKTPRDAVFAIFNAACTEILDDPSLGGALSSGWAHVVAFRLAQTNDPEAAGEGRRALIYFTIQCTNRLTA